MADDGSEIVVLDNDEEQDRLVYEEDEDDGRDWKENSKNGNVQQLKQLEDDSVKNLEAVLEKYRIEIGGLPKHYPIGQLKKLLNNTLQLDAHRVKPGGMGRNVAYASFKSDDARSKAMMVVEGYKWNNVTLNCKYAEAKCDPVLLAKIDYLKVPRKEHEGLSLKDRIKKAVTPLDDLSYKLQLERKEKVALGILRKFGTELTQLNPDLADFVHWHKIRRKGQICEVDPIVPSPVRDGYRNKCEFTIGKNYESDGPCVGFRVAAYKKGSVEVGPVDHLRHINDEMKKICKLMEDHITESGYEPFDPFSHEGIWRQLTIRTTNTGDIMLVIVMHPQKMDFDEITAIKQDAVNFFTIGDGQVANVTGIYFQQYGQLESGVPIEFEHVWGKTYIEESISGKRFRAGPDAFLQVNTHACEVLYNTIGELIDVDSTTCLLDICCGVGTIGLSLAEVCYKVIGVDSVSESIDNARANSELNGLTNVVYYNGTAEVFIDRMLERAEKSHSVAIVDPPRAGLNGSVMNALRKCDYLDRLVYISCDPTAALANFQALCRPRSKNYKGSYFVPVRAVPIDMFPGTDHYELVILFERYDECKWNRIMSGNPRPRDQAYFDRVPELQYKESERGGKREREEDWEEEDPNQGNFAQVDIWNRAEPDRGVKGLFDTPMDHHMPNRAPNQVMEDRNPVEMGFNQGYLAGIQQALGHGSQFNDRLGGRMMPEMDRDPGNTYPTQYPNLETSYSRDGPGGGNPRPGRDFFPSPGENSPNMGARGMQPMQSLMGPYNSGSNGSLSREGGFRTNDRNSTNTGWGENEERGSGGLFGPGRRLMGGNRGDGMYDSGVSGLFGSGSYGSSSGGSTRGGGRFSSSGLMGAGPPRDLFSSESDMGGRFGNMGGGGRPGGNKKWRGN